MQLKEMKVGSKGRIRRLLAAEPAYRHRLIAMGLLPGTELTVSRIAPLGDPLEILVRGFALSLRKHEATLLEIEEIKEVVTCSV
ncbi:MAG: iron transporter FeoA [Legionellales bacterium RIFCSPHIGHO2_12_FULL_35_11]|nr:MAG: iron transporter FeoA [Legionellales bacterium RIFCSPHIGHO2_12_FULL_35_11]